MEQNEVRESSKLQNQTDLGTSSSLYSKLIPPYLEYVRVELDRAVVTVERYRARLQRFINEMGIAVPEKLHQRSLFCISGILWMLD
jgi:hypothetical protein